MIGANRTNMLDRAMEDRSDDEDVRAGHASHTQYGTAPLPVLPDRPRGQARA
jgi:hypothetical protein